MTRKLTPQQEAVSAALIESANPQDVFDSKLENLRRAWTAQAEQRIAAIDKQCAEWCWLFLCSLALNGVFLIAIIIDILGGV